MKTRGVFALPAISLGLLAASAFAEGSAGELTYIGRSSVKIRTATGYVIYIDPYAPGDYSEAADLVLVTHGHSDHNQVRLVSRKAGTVIVAPAGAVAASASRAVSAGAELELDNGRIKIEVLPAANANHSRKECVGYLLLFDGITLYHAGDTDYLPEMEGLAARGVDYALLPCDGFYNMGPAEAAKCAKAMNARHVLPIHSSKSGSFDEKNARAVGGSAKGGPELIVLKPGEKSALGD
jgi:L-ascorbate metabolism protein UlaG (beta-lactamase superfamily)